MMIAFIFAVLGGIARYYDGQGIPHGMTWLRNGYMLAAALASAWWGLGLDWWALGFGVVAAMTLIPGHTDWDDPKFMAIRYGGPPLVVTILHMMFTPASALGLVWPLSAVLLGLVYGTLKHMENGRAPQGTAEAIAGAVILGGPAFL